METMEDHLIKAVYQRRTIWDPNDEFRRNSRNLTRLWYDISEETGIDVKTAKARWKNLRSYYVREFYKMKRRRGVNKISTWPFFHQLSFLEQAILTYRYRPATTIRSEPKSLRMRLLGKKKRILNHEPEPEPEPEEPEPEPEPEVEQEPEIEIETEQEHYEHVEASDTESSNASSKNFIKEDQYVDTSEIHPEFVSYMKKNQDILIDIEKRKLAMLEKENATPDDDDLLFFKSLIPYFKRLPDIRRLRLRSKINDLILQEIEELNSEYI